MSKTKLLLRAAMVALLLASAGSAAFAQTQQPPGQQPAEEPRITGGTAVPEGRYPFMAALLDTRLAHEDELFQHFCGGSLIAPTYVLTAAHCVDAHGPGRTFTSRNWHLMSVVLGRTRLTNTTQGQVRAVHHVYIPGGWNPTDPHRKFDVAVLQLSGPPVVGIKPVEIASVDDNWHEQAGKRQTVAGWGQTSPGGASSNALLEARLPIVSDAEAANTFPGVFDPATMIAAGGGGARVCKGDSGGPLFATWKGLGPGTGRYSQHGIAARTLHVDLCKPGYDGYTEVNNPQIRQWIMSRAFGV
jgi:secreted trypsin-like serine protease